MGAEEEGEWSEKMKAWRSILSHNGWSSWAVKTKLPRHHLRFLFSKRETKSLFLFPWLLQGQTAVMEVTWRQLITLIANNTCQFLILDQCCLGNSHRLNWFVVNAWLLRGPNSTADWVIASRRLGLQKVAERSGTILQQDEWSCSPSTYTDHCFL